MGRMQVAPDPIRGRRRWLRLAVVAAVVVGVAFAGWWAFLRTAWGDVTRRIASPTGDYEVVQYEFSAMIDTGWNLAIERTNGGGRQWFWHSVEGPAPEAITFTGPTSVEVTTDSGGVFEMEFDPDSLEPNRRFCLNPEYCRDDPWNDYTRK